MWYCTYTVGDLDIDQEHANIDTMLSCISNEEEQGREDLKRLIDALCRHFVNEEQTAKKRGYLMNEQHLAKHRDLEGQLKIVKDSLGEPHTDCETVAASLKEMLRTHIMEFDRFLVPKAP